MKRNSFYRIRQLGDKYYLFGYGHCFEINYIAKAIWVGIGKNMKIDEIATVIMNKTNQKDKEVIEKDILEFIEQLKHIGAIIE